MAEYKEALRSAEDELRKAKGGSAGGSSSRISQPQGKGKAKMESW